MMTSASLFSFLSLLIHIALSHPKCGHDNFNHVIHRNIRTSLPKQHHKYLNKRTLQNYAEEDEEIWQNIRIAFNADGLLDGWSDTSFKNWFAIDVIPAAIAYLEKGKNMLLISWHTPNSISTKQ